MKKNYLSPNAMVVSMSFDEHIYASGSELVPGYGTCLYHYKYMIDGTVHQDDNTCHDKWWYEPNIGPQGA